MTARIFVLILLLLNISFSVEGKSRTLGAGTYSRYHQNRDFRIIPSADFDDFEPNAHGVTLINTADQLTITIHCFLIDNKDELNDQELLNRFKSISFRREFLKNITDLSNRKVTKAKLKSINGKSIFEFTLEDPYKQIKPLQSIVFYEYSKEYRITLEAENSAALKKHSHLIKNIFQTINILE